MQIEPFTFKKKDSEVTGLVIGVTERAEHLVALCLLDGKDRQPTILELSELEWLDVPHIKDEADDTASDELIECLQEIFDVVTTRDPSEEIHKVIATRIAEEIDVTTDDDAASSEQAL